MKSKCLIFLFAFAMMSCASTVSFNGHQVKVPANMTPTKKERNLYHYSFVIGFAGVGHFYEGRPRN